jgi:uncharacterized coiled-coil DUF342 family protein
VSDLLVLAIGLVLGGLCVATLIEVRKANELSSKAAALADRAVTEANGAHSRLRPINDQLDTHDHEIAKLYERANLRRD